MWLYVHLIRLRKKRRRGEEERREGEGRRGEERRGEEERREEEEEENGFGRRSVSEVLRHHPEDRRGKTPRDRDLQDAQLLLARPSEQAPPPWLQSADGAAETRRSDHHSA